jgi:two-component system, OmpR family, response regulator
MEQSNNISIKVLVVDIDIDFLKSLESEFQSANMYDMRIVNSGEECIEELTWQPDIVILDYALSGAKSKSMNGIETLVLIKQTNSAIQVIMLSGKDKVEIADNCIQHNAYDYVIKSDTAFYRLQLIIRNILYNKRIEAKLRWYMSQL